MGDSGVGLLDIVCVETFRLWSINALKSFLHIRGKITEGTLDDLAAR